VHSPRIRHLTIPRAEGLERRTLLSVNLVPDYSVSSYAGVGFKLNPVTEIEGSYNGQGDDSPSDYSVQIKWGDGTSADTGATSGGWRDQR
jgi:hypothetical protein